MMAPDAIILDEPTTGLDPQGRNLVWEKLAALKASGVTILMSTHYMDEAAALCDRLAIMHLGRILDEGTPDELIPASRQRRGGPTSHGGGGASRGSRRAGGSRPCLA